MPPALQGHTPDIVPRFDPEAAREHLRRSGLSRDELRGLEIAGIETWLDDFLLVVARTWKEVLDLDVPVRPWTLEQALAIGDPTEMAPIVITGWLPGYADPEYFLRLLFQTDSKTNYGGFSDPEFDQLIERARQERSDRSRLELFHEALCRRVRRGRNSRRAWSSRRGRSDGGRRPDRVHPARLRPEHVLREAVGHGVVGVREVLVVGRGPDDGGCHVERSLSAAGGSRV